MAKLQKSYVTWKDGEIKVVTKKPKEGDCEGYFNPADFDTSDPRALFLLWYTTLTIGLWEVPAMKSASDVYEELIENIDEFAEIDSLDCFTADHDVSWRKCNKTMDEEIARFDALHAKALEKGQVPRTTSTNEGVQARLDTARQFTEDWSSELLSIMDEWDSPMWRAAVARLADITVQWLINTEGADSRFRDWIVEHITSATASEPPYGEAVEKQYDEQLRAFIAEELKVAA